MNNLVKLNNKESITSLELLEQINLFREQEENRKELQHKDLLKIIRSEFDEEINEGNISPVEYEDKKGEKRPMFILTLSQSKQGTVWTDTATNHECDILTVSPSYWATEVEIKISLSDLKADFKKKHNHLSNAIKYFYYCIPEHLLQKSLNIIPKNYGILVAKPYKFNENVYCKIEQYRKSKPNKESRKLTEREVSEIWRKTMFRYWNNR